MTRRREQGVVLILLLFILSLGGMWYLVSHLDARSADFVARNRMHNATVLAAAKQALVGYVAHQAAVSGENNPGAFPCPEPAGNVGGANEGIVSGTCSLPAVGRFPWKTIGTDKFLDAAGEPLWYVVANGWAKPNALTTTVINSNCTDATSAMTCFSGQLKVDGQPSAALALIIAPGQAMNVQASDGDPDFDPGAAAEKLLEAARARAAEAKEREEAALEELDLTAREAEQRVRRAGRGAEREELLAALEELAAWYRDLVAAAAGAESALVHADRAEQLEEDGTLERLEGAVRAAELVRETWRSFEELQLSAGLALEALFVEIRRAFSGPVAAAS